MKHIKVPIRRLTTLSLTAVLTTAAMVGSPAHADEHQVTVAFTNGQGIHPRSSPSMAASKVGNAVPEGGTVSVVCETEGEAVSNGAANIFLWDKLADGSFVPNAFLATDTNGRTPGVPACEETTQPAPQQSTNRVRYNRYGAVIDAKRYAKSFHPLLATDCTYFVSRSMWYGGNLPQTSDWTEWSKDQGKWASKNLAPGVTVAAANANKFVQYTQQAGIATMKEVSWSDNTVGGADYGDIIAYDWNEGGADGVIDHLAMVTGFTPEGYPLVSQHSPGQVNRFWSWSEEQHNWIEKSVPGAKVYLLHITA